MFYLLKYYENPISNLCKAYLFCVFPILMLCKEYVTFKKGYAYHMFLLFLGYLNSKQTLFKSYLINSSLFHFTM